MSSEHSLRPLAHCWYGARLHQLEFIVCDGLAGKDYSGVGESLFSDDGQHLMCEMRRGQRMVVVIDGIEGPVHDEVIMQTHPLLWGPWSQRSVRFFVREEGRVKLMEADWPVGLDWTHGLKPMEEK